MTGLFALTLALFCSPAPSQEFRLDQIPPLEPQMLLVSQLNPNHHLLLAKEKGGDAFYALINEDGKISAPKTKARSIIDLESKSASVFLESGEHIVIPSGQEASYMSSTLGPAIIYPDRAPTPLRKVRISYVEMMRLRFTRFIASGSLEGPPIAAPTLIDEDYVPLRDIEAQVVVRLLFKSGVDYVMVAPEVVGAIRDQVPEDALVAFEVFDPKGIQTAIHRRISRTELIGIMDSLNDESLALQIRTSLLVTVRENAKLFPSLGEEEKIRVIKGVLLTLGDLDQVHSLLHGRALWETEIQDSRMGYSGASRGMLSTDNFRRTERHLIREVMLDPIRRVGRLGFEVLEKVDHPAARKVVIGSGDVIYGAGLPLLKGQPAETQHSYFREWLDQLRSEMSVIDRLPEQADYSVLRDLNLKMDVKSGHVFMNLDVNGQMTSIYSDAGPLLHRWVPGTSKRLPTFLFGLPGKKEDLKREFIQYIIEADKKAHKFSVWNELARNKAGYLPDRSFSVQGDYNLHRLILGLTSAPEIAMYAVPGFSEAEYTRTVIEIFHQLLEIADVSLVNSGTYASILDASSSLIGAVERKYGLNSRRQVRLAQAATQLQRLVHHRMLSALNRISMGSQNAEACANFLSPTP